jgi:hypothetical protein
MTQQNAALVEQSAAAAASLREQATRLAQAVATFRLEEAATSRPAAPAAVPAPTAAPVVRPAIPSARTSPRQAPARAARPAAASAPAAAAAAPAAVAADDAWETF